MVFAPYLRYMAETKKLVRVKAVPLDVHDHLLNFRTHLENLKNYLIKIK